MTGDRNCYVAELRTKFDPRKGLNTPGEINVAGLCQSECGEKLPKTSVRVHKHEIELESEQSLETLYIEF